MSIGYERDVTFDARKKLKIIKNAPIRDLRTETLDMVEVTGLEPAASWSQTKHSTKLSYTSD